MGSNETGAAAVARIALIAGVVASFAFLLAGFGLGAGLGLESGPAHGALQIGIITLLATPALRVVVLTVGFARERRSTFALVSFCVLLLLVASVMVGFG